MGRPEPPLTVAATQDAAAPHDGSVPRPRRRRVVALLVVLTLLLAAGATWWFRFRDPGPPPLTKADVAKAVAEGIAKDRLQQRAAPPDATVAYATILPSLVLIMTGAAPAPGASSGATPAPAPSGTPAAAPSDGSLGTGTVVNADGSILTALHVVDGAKQITVRFVDGTTATGTVVKRQEDQDLAVLAVDKLPQVVVPAVLGGGAQVGDTVFPVGNPFGLERTLTAGVVSATGRTIRTDADVTIKGLIQFDAAVNPGSSGGPLLNRDGQVVGVVTALANPGKQPFFVGIGFAVPIQTAGGVAGGPSI